LDAALSCPLLIRRHIHFALRIDIWWMDSFGLTGVSPRPHTAARSATSPIFLISFKGKVMKEIKKIGLVARLSALVRSAFGRPARRSVRIYVLNPERVFENPTPAQQRHLAFQHFLVHLELQRVARRQEQLALRRFKVRH
jgi:hypothetical protein